MGQSLPGLKAALGSAAYGHPGRLPFSVPQLRLRGTLVLSFRLMNFDLSQVGLELFTSAHGSD